MNPEPMSNNVVAAFKDIGEIGHHYRASFDEAILTEFITFSERKFTELQGVKVFVEGQDEGK